MFYKRLGIVLLSLIFTFGAASHLILIYSSFIGSNFCSKDFVQFYLSAKAQVAGANPYTDLAALRSTYIADTCTALPIEHSTPYPPSVIILFLPFARLSLFTAAILWLGLSICFQNLAVYFLCRLDRGKSLGRLECGAIFAWCNLSSPASVDLAVGNVNSLLLLLATLVIWGVSKKRELFAGAMTSLIFALKLWGGFLVFAMVLHRRKQYIKGFLFGSIAIGLFTASFSGASIYSSWLENIFAVRHNYEYAAQNLSLWTIGPRLYNGMDLSNGHFLIPPLFNIKELSLPFTILLLISLVSYSSILIYRRGWDMQLVAILCLASTFIHPIIWEHYFSLLALAATMTIYKEKEHRSPSIVPGNFVLLLPIFFWQEIVAILKGGLTLGAIPQVIVSLLLLYPIIVVWRYILLSIFYAETGIEGSDVSVGPKLKTNL